MLSFSYCQHRCAESRGGRSSQCTLTFAALLLLVSALPACRGVPVLSPQGLQGEQEMQDWNEIEDVCSSFLSVDSQSQASSALDELCYLLMGIVHKTQDTKPKDHAKRDDLQGPAGIQSRGYFLFRPRNGRRSTVLS
ncbi:neuromedin-U isoform X3 [Erpetoichthys calabaricus]|uniref:neuromedin-U isoform X3 n=1 Tax=Erpetoichthys calabaricus TaxID=27687 RepID=UPI0010A0117C|nr:neuromedin-U isoform X3 [Erpetoichthys calabaricus]